MTPISNETTSWKVFHSVVASRIIVIRTVSSNNNIIMIIIHVQRIEFKRNGGGVEGGKIEQFSCVFSTRVETMDA